MNTIELLRTSFYTFLQKAFALSTEQLAPITFTLNLDPSKAQFGDINSNAAMVLAKELKMNPRVVAQKIMDEFSHNDIQKTEIAGPGFLNFFLKAPFFDHLAQTLFTQQGQFFADTSLPQQKICLEFVSANPTGPLHLGHGRGGIIGDVLGNVLSFLGNKVTKEFYINDAGSQIDKLGESFKVRCQQELDIPAVIPEGGYHGSYLVDLAQAYVQKYGDALLQKPDEFFKDEAKNYMLEQLKKTLQDYGITFDVWFSEKTLHTSNAIPQALEQLTAHNHTFQKDGALWFASTAFGDDKDRVLRKQTGELTYIAADVAYLQNKTNRGFDKLIMILGQDHHSYVTRLKGIMQALGYNPDNLDVILYQLVTLKEGGEQMRMSKRAGNIVTLNDIIETVGTDVARFFYLNRKPDTHLEFDIELALKKTEENPVYYIQYAYVRTNSILQKAAAETVLQNITQEDLVHLGSDEQMLIKKVTSLKDTLQTIALHYQTHLLTYYVLDLAHELHSYYAKNRIIDPANPAQSRARLAMAMILNNTFKMCLQLLGLSTPQSM